MTPEIDAVIVYPSRLSFACSMPSCAWEIPISAWEIVFCDACFCFSIGQKITLEKDNVIYDGEVIEIGSAVDASTGLFRIKAAVKGDTQNLLSGTPA